MKSIRFMRNCWGNMASILVILSVAMLTACSSNPKVGEGVTYLEVKSQEIRINTFKTQMLELRPKLTQVPKELITTATEPPPNYLSSLATYLESNDCTDPQLSNQSKEACYRVTRVLLINTTRKLDETNMTLYVGQRTVTQMVQTINEMVDALNETGK